MTDQEATHLCQQAACPDSARVRQDDPADGLGRKPEVCSDCGHATVTTHNDGSKTCGHCYMKRAYDLGVLTGRRPREYR